MIDTRDTSSLDALESLVISDGWALVVKRLNYGLERYRDGLENERDATKASELRGAAGALRTVLGLPAILQAEMEAEMKK